MFSCPCGKQQCLSHSSFYGDIFTYHKNPPFKVHNSVVSSVFRVVQPSLLLSERFHHPKGNLHPCASLPQPPAATNLQSVDLPILDTSYKWNHTICGIRGLPFLASSFSAVLSRFIPVVVCV